MITFATLRDLSTASIGPASDAYHSAGGKLRTASSDYRAHVVAPIDSRHIWLGVGRGHAETVARVERLALATAGARMRTVGTTLDTLQAELAAAKKELQSVVDDAARHDYRVDDTGTVKPGPTHKSMTVPSIGGVDTARVWGDQEAARYEARMRLAVRRAQRADKACGQVLDTVIGASFVTTTTAQPGVLARAKDAYDTARGGELYASLLHKLLLAAHRQDSYATDHKEYGYPDHGIGVGKGLWAWGSGTVRDLIGLIGLIGLAASGDPGARAALKAIPSSTWKQLSTARGWENLVKDVFDWRDLAEGRPGEFLGNNLPWLICLIDAANGVKGIRATTQEGNLHNLAELSGLLRSAARGKGNFGLGQSTYATAKEAGTAWVGPGYRTARGGKLLISADGLRQFRMPSYKPQLGFWQANFEERLVPKGQWQSNGHLDIVDRP